MEEVAALLEQPDVPPEAPIRRAIGVEEIATMLRGEITTSEAISQSVLATRRYAKRQYTWFRHQPPADWLRCDAANPQFYFSENV